MDLERVPLLRSVDEQKIRNSKKSFQNVIPRDDTTQLESPGLSPNGTAGEIITTSSVCSSYGGHHQDDGSYERSAKNEEAATTFAEPKSAKLNKRQWLTVFVFGIANLASAVCISLQAPFYPEEAESKGATPSEYGFVFGIYELTCFLTSPLFGKYLPHLGPRFVYNAGIFLTAGSCILFGFLSMVKGHVAFLGLSFAVRVVEALGSAGTLTATFAIIASEFPKSVATTFASLETFFGLGLIVGPTIGGLLYEVGEFLLPFLVNGVLLLLAGLLSLILLPRDPSEDTAKDTANTLLASRNSGLLAMLRVPSVTLSAVSIVCASLTNGFIAATLEPHLRQFQLSAVFMGLMFIVSGGMYAIIAPFAGWICDRGAKPKVLSAIGNLSITVSFLLIGPAPFIPMNTTLWMVIIGLLFHGGGVGLVLVAAFADGLHSATKNGFADDIGTYAIMSGLWTSAFALGAFIGPSMGGILLDLVGFRIGSLANVALQLLVFFAHVVFLRTEAASRRPKYMRLQNMEPLIIPSCSTKSG